MLIYNILLAIIGPLLFLIKDTDLKQRKGSI